MVAFTTSSETSDNINLLQVVGWPDGVTTKEKAKSAYVALKLDGKIVLMRHAGTLEAKVETVTRFK